jgi:hypothetical protein
MKKALLFSIVLAFTLGLYAQTSKLKDAKPYEIKSGKIEYKIDGKTKGTKTLWWDDYGRLTHEYKKTSTKMMGMTTKEETISIRSSEWMYSINLIEKTGTKTSVDEAMMLGEMFMGTTNEAELEKVAEDIKKDFDAKDVGTEKILGYDCIIMDIGKLNGKHWRHKGVTLKMEIIMGGFLGNILEEATSFDQNISVPASKFEVPAGIKIEEVKITNPFEMDDDDDDDE